MPDKSWRSKGTCNRIVSGLVIGICLTISSCAGPPVSESEWAAPKNVVLVSIDTLRADRLSAYGYSVPTSPFLEELGRESVVFDRFYYSGGGTLPSHMTMMTSLFPRTHFVHPGNQRVLEEGRVTLAEQLREIGFRTAAFTDAGWMRGKFGFYQGFDVYDDAGGRFETILPKAFDWLEANHDERFFLFLHTYDVHSEHATRLPYSCPDEFEKFFLSPEQREIFDGCKSELCATKLLKTINQGVMEGTATVAGELTPEELAVISSLYDGCIRYADGKIEEIVEKLKSLGAWEDTLFVVTSDHGEEFAEHGMLLHEQGGYEEISWLPLIVRFPGGRGAGTRVPHLATMVDVMPTILEAMETPLNEQAQGLSAFPAIFEDQPFREDIHMYAVLWDGRWKYFSNKQELYDLSADPAEAYNLWSDETDLLAGFERRVRELARIDVTACEEFLAVQELPGGEVNLTETEIENLRALGYLE